MATVALQQVSSKVARDNAARTLEKGIALKYLRPYTAPQLYASLKKSCTDGVVFVWGSKPERVHQTRKIVHRNSIVLFRRGSNIYKYGVTIEKTKSAALAEALWGWDSDGETWSTVYFFSRLKDKIIPVGRMNPVLGRSMKDNWQGLVVLSLRESEGLNGFLRKELNAL